MMWLLTFANDAILVALTFTLPLEFDSNLRRYSFAFCESELLANNRGTQRPFSGKYLFGAL